VKESSSPQKRNLLLAATFGGLGILMANAAELSKEDFFAEFPDQLDFPVIVLQPLDQLAAIGHSATFEVTAENGPLTYQWLRNGAAMAGETNATLTLKEVTINDVARYSCNVSKGTEIVPTRGAHLMVSSAAPVGGSFLTESGSSSFTVSALPTASSGSSGSCPGSYVGYVNYTKTVAQGWGWEPSADTSVHTATDTNRADTKLYYYGKSADSGCNQTTVSVPHPAYSTKYRFTIYFTNNVPTNAYAILLDGFNP
jgi:hypothetical protein